MHEAAILAQLADTSTDPSSGLTGTVIAAISGIVVTVVTIVGKKWADARRRPDPDATQAALNYRHLSDRLKDVEDDFEELHRISDWQGEVIRIQDDEIFDLRAAHAAIVAAPPAPPRRPRPARPR